MKTTLSRCCGSGLAATLALMLGACSSPPKQPPAPPPISDRAITEAVAEAIDKDPQIKTGEINVSTRQGVVQLTGNVNTRKAAARAGELAKAAKGVKGVKNNLVVK